MENQYAERKYTDLRPCVPHKMRETIHNIAKNKDISISSLLRPLFQQLIDETPDRYKRDPNV